MEVAAEEVCVVEERDHTYAQQEQVRILMNNLSKCLTLVRDQIWDQINYTFK